LNVLPEMLWEETRGGYDTVASQCLKKNATGIMQRVTVGIYFV